NFLCSSHLAAPTLRRAEVPSRALRNFWATRQRTKRSASEGIQKRDPVHRTYFALRACVSSHRLLCHAIPVIVLNTLSPRIVHYCMARKGAGRRSDAGLINSGLTPIPAPLC